MFTKLNCNALRTSVFCLALTTAGGTVAVFAADTKAEKEQKQKDDMSEARSENRDFLKKAFQSGLAEIEMGRLARDQASDEGVKKFAAMMVIDHQKANKEIESIAEARHITLTEKVADDADMKHDKLAKMKGAEFDKAYITSQVEMHNEAIKLFSDAQKTEDPKIDAFVKDTLPTLREHHKKAQDLREQLK